MAKREFTMNGKSYHTLTAIAAELGVKRVYTRDFVKYGITEVTAADATVAINKSVNILSDDAADATDDQSDATVQDNVADNMVDDQADETDVTAVDNPLNTGGSAIIFAHTTADGIAVDKVIDVDCQVAGDVIDDVDSSQDAPADEVDIPSDDAADATDDQSDDADDKVVVSVVDAKPAPTKPLTEEELIAQIERDVVDYADATELSQHLRKVSLNGLIKMAENVQVDTWERMANAGIRKMRVIMELKKAYFPTQPTRTNVSTGPSPWKKIPTADLQAVAMAKGCVWKDCANEGILRMRLIMVLKAVGVTADEFKG